MSRSAMARGVVSVLVATVLVAGVIGPSAHGLAISAASGRTPSGLGVGDSFGTHEFGEATPLTPRRPIGTSVVAHPRLNGDGSVIVFGTSRPDLLMTSTVGDVVVQTGDTSMTPYTAASMKGAGGAQYYAACPEVSRDGRFVMFCSFSPKLVPGDTNRQIDTFVYDRATGKTDRVNVSTTGVQTTDWVRTAAISATGRYVAFRTETALVPEDTNGVADVYVRDRTRGTTERVSVSSAGRQGNSGSSFEFDSPLAISGDGRYVVFDSGATNLVPGDTNRVLDVFIRDRKRGITERVNVDDQGHQMALNPTYRLATSTETTSVSDDGRYIAFQTDGRGIGGVTGDYDQNQFLRDRRTGTTRLVSQKNGQPAAVFAFAGNGQLTPDGRLVLFTSNSKVLAPWSGNAAIYVYDVATAAITRAHSPGPSDLLGDVTDDGHTLIYVNADPDKNRSVILTRSIS